MGAIGSIPVSISDPFSIGIRISALIEEISKEEYRDIIRDADRNKRKDY
jgi:hypothetical protein